MPNVYSRRRASPSSYRQRIAASVALVLTVAGFVTWNSVVDWSKCDPVQGRQLVSPPVTPWASVGGCGAGGSGGSGGGAKWVGLGVSGGLIDLQAMYTATVMRTIDMKSVSLRISGKPTWVYTVGLSIPYNNKFGQMQFKSNQAPKYAKNAGLGDVSVDVSRAIGAEGQFSVNLGLTLPTGQYDTKRGEDASPYFLTGGLQNGKGLYNANVGLSYTKDVEDGMWLFDWSYSMPFNMKLFSGENRFIGEGEYYAKYASYKDSSDSRNKKRFYYRFKPYGENDMGDYTPPSISGSIYYGYRGIEGYVHSWGLTYSFPIAGIKIGGWHASQPWMHSEATDTYDPKPDPDYTPWSTSLNYGLEIGSRKFPVLLAISKPFKAASSKSGEWTGPDWKDFEESWSLTVGVKATMF